MKTQTVFSEFPQLETDRLILRETHPTDVEAIFRIFADPDVTRYHDVDTASHIDQAKQLIERRAARFRNGQGIRWAIVTKADDRLIGSCGFSWQAPFRGEVGYELAKVSWGKGFMTEALSTIVDFGFGQIGFHRLEAMVMLGNIASTRVLEKLGFVEEGLLREYGFWKGQFHDLKLFSLLKSD